MSLIQKKDNRLDELKSLIADEIQPKLEKLRKDQQQYQEYQKICRDIEYLTRVHVSYKYLQYTKNLENSETTINKLKSEIEKCKENIAKNLDEVKELEASVQEIQEQTDSVSYFKTFEVLLSLKIIANWRRFERVGEGA